jgi:Fe-S-cluster-containing hydrogenase component 2
MITIDLSKCTGCHRCETACSFYHTGKVSNRLARIKVVNLFELGIDGPVVCQQCQEKYCLDCPYNAISLGSNGQIIVSPTICKLCGRCEAACPIGAIQLFDGYVFVCDLCGGNPKCVEACTEGAITYEPSKTGPSFKELKEQQKSEKSKLNSSEKRKRFIKEKGMKLRKEWEKKVNKDA